MANFNQLEVYKTAYDLSLSIFRLTEKMNRTFKYTLGEKLNNNAVELLMCIYKANADKTTRYDQLQSGRENVLEIRLLLRLMKDLKIVNLNAFVQMNDMIESIAKQFYGWQKISIPAKKTPGPGTLF